MELKWLFIMFAVMAVAAAFSSGWTDHNDAQVKIACYEAAKSNPNIKCKE